LADRNPRPPGVRIIGLRLRGFAHPGSPFRTGRCYPITAGRSSPGLHPLRGVPPRGLGLCRHRPPLMGFDTALDDWYRPDGPRMVYRSRTTIVVIVVSALQSFKEPRDWLVSIRDCRPP
jgi:hypothetical protein